MKTNQPLLNKSFQLTLSKTFKNYFRLKNYVELINKMFNDYNSIISEYESISSDYIQKLTNLSSKYSEIIVEYEKTLIYSDGKLKDLLKLFQRIPSIFNLQKVRLQSIQVVLNECGVNSGSEKEDVPKFEDLVNEFETKDKKINRYFSDLENNNKNLFDTYNFIEDSLKIISIGNGNKKVAMNEIIMQNFQNINEKEQMYVKSIKDLTKYKKEYFQCYDKFVTFSENKFKEKLILLKSNVSTFATIFLTYFKTAHGEMEQIIKNISENEMKVDFSKLLSDIVGNVDRDFSMNKYVIKLINNNYIEDKNKEYNLSKLRKEHYFIKDDKIYLKNEDVYEIIKMMYGQFQFIEEKYYNLVEEQKKIRIKNLTDKILSYGKKSQNIFSLDEIISIKDEEVTHLISLLNKPIYRFEFLKIYNLFRTQGMCEMPEREFEITKKIFLFIADKIKEESDVLSAKLILILSQTFYIKVNEEKIYLFKYLQKHEMFSNLEVWEKYLTEMIEEDLNRSKIDESKDSIKDPNKIAIINNVLLAHMLTFCHNMVEFRMKEENIKKIIEPMMSKYNLTEDSIKQIHELIQNELKGKDINNA